MSTTVLLALGDRLVREPLSAYLSREGYHVEETASGVKAFVYASVHEPKLVITDTVLLDRNGLELTAQLRKRRNARQLPILFVSRYASFSDDALTVGANAFLVHEEAGDWQLLLMQISTLLAA